MWRFPTEFYKFPIDVRNTVQQLMCMPRYRRQLWSNGRHIGRCWRTWPRFSSARWYWHVVWVADSRLRFLDVSSRHFISFIC